MNVKSKMNSRGVPEGIAANKTKTEKTIERGDVQIGANFRVALSANSASTQA